MTLIRPSESEFIKAVSRLAYCNPLLPERIEAERAALGPDFRGPQEVYRWRAEADPEHHDLARLGEPNLLRLQEGVDRMATELRRRLREGATAAEREFLLYEDLVFYLLYRRYRRDFDQTIAPAHQPRSTQPRIGFWRRFLHDFTHFLTLPDRTLPSRYDPADLFAGFFQIRRALHHIFYYILGASHPATRLRAQVWQSIFTHDMRRYARSLYKRMGDITTLITGPSGTGKELVARAIGLSRFIRFEPHKEQFASDFAGEFYAVNLSALAPTLIESELFGHKEGAFTGAVSSRKGWLEECEQTGTVFLDEIGELEATLQVKLLRVLEDRTFQRLGETQNRHFHGKIIAATNRNLAGEMRGGRFREDLYYRLCADMITTPSLREQLAHSPHDLHDLIVFIAKREVGQEAQALAEEVETWVDAQLGRNYPWPGNVRELEQCVRNVMVRKEYHPAHVAADDPTDDPRRALAGAVEEGTLTAEQLVRRYCTLVYVHSGSFQEAARRLKLDRRTVRNKIDHDLLRELRR